MSQPQRHRLLSRQLKRFGLNQDSATHPLDAFLEAINDAYHRADEDREMLERSLELSSQELLQANRELQGILKAIPDEVISLDRHGVITHFKKGSLKLGLLKTQYPVGKKLVDVCRAPFWERFQYGMQDVRHSGRALTLEISNATPQNDRVSEARIIPLEKGALMLVVRDISDRKDFEERVANIAYRDSLTGLPNRMLFTDRLQQAMSLARRNRNMVAIMFLDLDRFKNINDTLGHTYGDKLLVNVTERLVECLRETDTIAKYQDHEPTSTLARLGGDEFTIILSEIKGVQDVTRVATRILRTISQPIYLKGEQIRVTMSIGIALYPIDGQDVDGLLRNADAALYHAKERGKNNYQLYTESINSVSHQRLQLETQLRKAIEEDQLELYYQPQLNLKTGRVEGMEALVRWFHPERGFISPSLFIPIAEESELIGEIGRWVLRKACEQSMKWIEMGYDWLCISVNVSGQQFKEGQLIHSLERVLKEIPVPYHNLGIEITETAIMANPELSADMLKIIRAMDVKISLDDFGTGYSSLNYLKQFPIDVLKIDQSFVREMTTNDQDAALTDAIIAMSHALGLKVIAEGVETEDHLAFLTAKDCDIIQGFHYCRPLPVDKVTAFLETQVPRDR